MLVGAETRACGIAPSGRAPSLELERVLLIHDAAKQREHFIRELTFGEATEPFGFLVPTPGRPELGKVEGGPLAKIALELPVTDHSIGFGADDAVKVLQVERIGRFTGVVLGARDAAALARWLTTHRFTKTEPLAAWLDHYVRLGFYFVALRYDPPAAAAAKGATGTKTAKATTPSGLLPKGTEAETVRISFDTPLPYYPYFEPRGQGASARRRALQMWLVASAEAAPVSVVQKAAEIPRWVRPLSLVRSLNDPSRTGATTTRTPGGPETNRKKLMRALDDSLEQLLPAGPLVVQVFEDQKTDRTGYGDIVFTPAQPTPLDAARRARVEPLLRVLSPEIYAR